MMKINKLEIENVKRVKAVKIKPNQNGLTIIGGKNGQGKTSVLDSIAWALGGNKFKPSSPQRDGSVIPPNLHIVMNNGLIVERKGKNSDLKVIDPSGNKAGQELLNNFVEELAINLPKFINLSDKEKAEILLQIIGVGPQLAELERQEKEMYNQRHAIGVIADQKEKFAAEQPYYPDVPKDLVSSSELIKQQQDILAKNGENQRLRTNLQSLIIAKDNAVKETEILLSKINDLQNQLNDKNKQIEELNMNIITAQKTVEQLHDESTEELEKNLFEIEEINQKVRANLNKDKAEDDAKEFKEQYNSMTNKINNIRQEKINLLKNANLPLPELSVEEGELIYKGFKWDNMSSSDQLKVATAIVRKLKPECGFILIDKLEQMDLDTMKEFGEWLEQEGLQAIATRVSTGDECSIIIEDGYVKEEEPEWKF